MTSRPDDLGLMTGSYALDAVTDEERQAIEAALATSDEMRAEADSLRQTALLLAYAAETIEPPADLKASLMAKIATTPQRPAQTARHSDTATETPSVPKPVEHIAPVADVAVSTSGTASSTARARWFQRPGRVILSAAAAVAIITGGTLGVNALVQPTTPGTSTQASAIGKITAASDFERSTTPVSTGGTATVVWSNKLGKSAVILKGVQAAPAGKTYELWYIGSTITPAGLVDHVDGTTSAVLEGTKRTGDTVGITIEPAGGSKQPTTEPIAAVSTQA
ncbi:anti-sigma factor [Curtobacterium sp. RRHDQ10]|uniref:anti-sigma factor n=1 Tax=Curtobacterium phyllosphaerae TaxID=3413379 RepID=UPI003BF3EFF5